MQTRIILLRTKDYGSITFLKDFADIFFYHPLPESTRLTLEEHEVKFGAKFVINNVKFFQTIFFTRIINLIYFFITSFIYLLIYFFNFFFCRFIFFISFSSGGIRSFLSFQIFISAKIFSLFNNLINTFLEKFFREVKIDKSQPREFHLLYPTWRLSLQVGNNFFGFASLNTYVSRVVSHL